MSYCIICFLRKSYHPSRFLQSSLDQQRLSSSNLITEVEDSCKFSLNLLMTLLAFFAVSGSKALQPVVLTLLIYTISLRLANTCFLHNYPTWSRFLQVIPHLGTACMAGVELVSSLQSPTLATVGILFGVLPLGTIVIHHGRQCGETSAAGLPVRMQPVLAPGAGSASANITLVSN